MNTPSDDASAVASRRRSRRDSRVRFSISTGRLQVGIGVLVASWVVAYGLGRQASVSDTNAPPPDRPLKVRAASTSMGWEAPSLPSPPAPVVTAVSATIAAGPAAKEAPVKPEPPPALTFREVAPDDGFGIQIGAYPQRDEAEAALQSLAAEIEGLDAYLIAVEIPGKGTWYRVRLGHFDSRAAADLRRKTLSVAEGALSLPYR